MSVHHSAAHPLCGDRVRSVSRSWVVYLLRAWRLAIATTPLLVSPPSTAGNAGVATLVGSWSYDRTHSREIDPDLWISKSATGHLSLRNGSGMAYDFDLAGGVHPLAHGGTLSWHATAPDHWLAARWTESHEPVDTVFVQLAGNTLRCETHAKLPNGSPYTRTVTYRRATLGKGLIGRWRTIEVDNEVPWDGFVISSSPDGTITWQIPTDLQQFSGHMNGSDMPIVGPHGPTGSAFAMRPEGPRRFSYMRKDQGRVTERGIITVSRDLRWLTEVSWPVGQPDRKSKLVYKRDH